MSAPIKLPSSRHEQVPLLENGDRRDRLDLERRYDAMAEVNQTQLVEGVIYPPSPLGHGHHSGLASSERAAFAAKIRDHDKES